MTDRERQYISTIAQLGSITSAAKELYIAQPSLTQALRRIEGKCGVSLFQRGKKGLQLTEAGKNYLTTTEKIEKLFRQMEEEIRSAESYNDSLKLGITSFQGSLLLPEVLYAFSKKYPSVDVHLVESSSSQLELMAYKGRLDLILIHRPFREYDLNYISMGTEPFLLAVAPDNRDYLEISARGEKVPLATADILNRQHFIRLTGNQRIRQIGDNICVMAGVLPKEVFSTASPLTAAGMVAQGLGVSFLPAGIAAFCSKQYKLEFFQLPEEWNGRWELVAAYDKHTPPSETCWEMIRIFQEHIVESEMFE